MKILVTGGAGYIGSILVRKLLKKGHKVTVLDKLNFGSESIKDLDLNLIQGDICNIKDIMNATKDVDAIIHLAAIVGDPSGNLIQDETIKTNHLATKLLVDVAKELKIKKFIFASTCSIYGFREGICTEETEPNPLSLYAKTKVDAENVVRNATELNPTILRLGTVFGTSHRMRFDLVANLLMAKALWDKKITVYGKGTQFRPFVNVHDVADVMCLSLENDLVGTFNVGSNSRNFSVKELAEKIKETVSEAEIVFILEKEDERSYSVNFEKIKNEDFLPKITIKDSIKKLNLLKLNKKIIDYTDDKYSNFKTLKKSLDI